MTLLEASQLAALFRDDYARYFSRLEVAGSVRRQKAEVKDLELAGILPNEQRELFIHAIDTDNRFRCLKPGTPERIPWPIKRDGKYWKFAFGEGVRFGPQDGERRIDLFLAQPENWGLIYLIRTGPDFFGQFCLTRWKQVSPRNQNGEAAYSKDGFLHTANGVRVPTPEESDVFNALHMAYIEPEVREQAVEMPEVLR